MTGITKEREWEGGGGKYKNGNDWNTLISQRILVVTFFAMMVP